nr:NADH dehydrogenase subunit 4L [Notomastus sp. GK-2021]
MESLQTLIPLSNYFLISAAALYCAFLRQRMHFLLALLALELTIVILMGGALISTTVSGIQAETLAFIFLTTSACEASLGLAILVMMVRANGNDLITSLHTNKT